MVQPLPFRYDLFAAGPQDAAVKNDLASASAPAPLDGASAFVVHLTSTDSRHTGVVSGRVEHVTSGRSIRFSTTTQLVEFMSSVVDMGRHAAREGRFGDRQRQGKS